MNKSEFVDSILKAEDAPEGISKKDAQKLLDLTFEQLREAVKEEGRFAVSGFGTFSRKDRPARDGRNPRTGETIKIPASTTVSFKPSADLKRFMSEK